MAWIAWVVLLVSFQGEGAEAPPRAAGPGESDPELATLLVQLEEALRAREPGAEVLLEEARLRVEARDEGIWWARFEALDGLRHHLAGRFSEAIEIYRSGIDRVEGPDPTRGRILVRLGTALMQLGDQESAVLETQRGLRELGEDGDPFLIMCAHNTLGILRQSSGHQELAVDHYFEAVQIATTSDLLEHAAPLWLNIGTIKSYQRDHEGALAAYRKARQINDQIGMSDRNGHLLYCMGLAWRDLERPDKTREAMWAGLGYAENLDDPRTIATLRRGLCSLELGARNYEAADEHARIALREEERCENPPGLVTSLLRLADTSSRLGNDLAAREHLDRAEDILGGLDNRDLAHDFHSTSQRVARRMGLESEARRHAQASADLEARISENKDSLHLAQRLARKEIETERLAHALDRERSELARASREAEAVAWRWAFGTGLFGLLTVVLVVSLYARTSTRRSRELALSLERVRVLEGLLPICATCKQIRDPHGDWHAVESYLSDHTDAQFSHGICPSCDWD